MLNNVGRKKIVSHYHHCEEKQRQKPVPKREKSRTTVALDGRSGVRGGAVIGVLRLTPLVYRLALEGNKHTEVKHGKVVVVLQETLVSTKLDG